MSMNWPVHSNYSQLIRLLPPHDYAKVVELGARDCVDTLWLQRFFECDIITWECNPEAIELCKKTLDKIGRVQVWAGLDYNHFMSERFDLVEKAAWSETKSLTFRPVTNGNLGASSVFTANPDYPYETYEQDEIEVEAMRLDEWWGHSKHWDEPIDLLVMDIQGAELEALKGAGDLLCDIEAIITEGQTKPIYEGVGLIDEIAAHLRGYGFVLSAAIQSNDWFGDYLFVREH